VGSRAAIGRRGFTLLELLVTLLVVALAVAVILPAVGRNTETIRLRAEVAGFAAMYRHAREQAITTRAAHAVVLDAEGRRLTLVKGEDEVRRTRPISERFAVRAESSPVVRFEPEGTSSGGRFQLAAGATTWRVTVDAVTGRVRSARE
jgi:prepilin-type N-terminal cleavage/methylation domain-containing protein